MKIFLEGNQRQTSNVLKRTFRPGVNDVPEETAKELCECAEQSVPTARVEEDGKFVDKPTRKPLFRMLSDAEAAELEAAAKKRAEEETNAKAEARDKKRASIKAAKEAKAKKKSGAVDAESSARGAKPPKGVK